MKYIVYLTLNVKNNKIYVGVHSTEDPTIFDGYLGCGIMRNSPSSYKNSKTPLQFAVNKYGVDAFKRTVLKVFDSEEEAYKLEYEIVTTEFIKRKDVYNVTVGGGKPPKQDRIIYQYDTVGNFIKQWDSIVQASAYFNCSDTAISNAIKYKGSSVGYFWSYELFDNLDTLSYTNNSNKQLVYQYSLEGVLTNTYESIMDAAENNSETSSTIGRAIQGSYLVKTHYYSLSFFNKFIPQEKITIKGQHIHLYDIEGNYFKSFNTPIEAAKYFNLKSSSEISKALRLGRLFKNYQVSLEKVDNMKKLENLKNKAKKVGKFDKNNVLLETFKSITEACEFYGTGVQKVLRGQQQYCKEFIFKYI